MDRQEAVSREEAVRTISRISGGSVSYAEDLYDSFFPKPVVPQCVADWYEEIKDSFGYNLTEAINSIPVPIDGEELSDFEKWLLDDEQALTTLVNMHQFGYEVEKEARYTVRIKGRLGQYLGKYYLNNEELTPQFIRTLKGEGSVFTRTELETSGFGWVFDCEGVEVKEVE
nr:MAG: Protein of unknown function (DUF1642) [Bacteriophage sp.]